MKILEWLLGTQQLAGADWNFRFLAEYEPWLKFVLFVVLAFLVYLTVRSYRREGDTRTSAKATFPMPAEADSSPYARRRDARMRERTSRKLKGLTT